MFELFDIKIKLPPALAWLGGTPLTSALLTIGAWLLLGILGYLLLFEVVHRFARRTQTEVDDVILRASRNPLLALAALFGVRDALDVIAGREGSLGQVETILESIAVLVIAYWVWLVFRQVVIYYGEEYAERSETSVDDILLPIVNQAAPLLIFGFAATIVARKFGFEPATLLVAIGGAAFIAAFALQDSLSNIFSGISLLVDTPFRYGDLVIIDEKVYVIQKIGLRVTQLYNADEHMVILMPNNQMANERLINITRPTPALMTPIHVAVARDNDPRAVMALLREVANAHPNVLGDLRTKLGTIDRAALRLADQGRWDEAALAVKEHKRLELEHQVNDELEALAAQLDNLAIRIEEREQGGLDAREREEVQEYLEETRKLIQTLKQTLTEWLLLMRFTLVETVDTPQRVEALRQLVEHYSTEVRRACAGGEIVLLGDLLVQRKESLALRRQTDTLLNRHGFRSLDSGLHDLDQLDEFGEFIRLWNKKVQRLEQGCEALCTALDRGEERRLDDAVRALRDWAYSGLKETTPEWKYPDVVFEDLGPGGFHFTLEVFVDDIRLEHFERQERVVTELRRDIVEAFRAAGISFATPRQEVTLSPRSRVEVREARE
ncbi:MAG: mechanosensitive ion channel [Ardenticatenaceae bacterium]|nr:mechanosensitive ion channel [Ardenticatenaceae bacterium]